MRLQSRQQVKVKNTIIGGDKPLVCLPVVAGNKAGLLSQAKEISGLDPDLIEWRIDGYANVRDIRDCLDALEALQAIIQQVPLIFTCRIKAEGGLADIPDQVRLDLISAAMDTGFADIVDTELCNNDKFIDTVVSTAKSSGSKVILSSHDFEKTPPKDVIIERLTRAREKGADIAKLAAMPQSAEDVLSLMEATLAARNGSVDIPMITISMGEMGAVSRVAGGIFGSDITFAIGKTASAPGQIPIQDLRQAMSVLY